MDPPDKSIDHAVDWEETNVIVEEVLFEPDTNNDNTDNNIVEDVPPPVLDPEEDDPFLQLETELEEAPQSQVTKILRGINHPTQAIENASQSQ